MRLAQHLRTAMQLLRAGKPDAAEAEYRRALDLDPNTPDALHFLGLIQHQRGQSERGIELMRRAIQVAPNVASYHNNLGEALRATNQIDAAEHEFEQTIRLQPAHAQAFNNLGMIAFSRGRTDEAIRWLERAIATRPDYARAHWNLSLVLLGNGDFERGFTEFEWRFRDPSLQIPPRFANRPAWDGSDVTGRVLLLHAEQGLGDTIQFVRYAPLLSQRGASVIVEVQPELKRLIQTVPGVQQVIARGEPVPSFDVHAPLMSLPRLFGTTIDTIPANVPYLKPDSQLSSVWKARLAPPRSAKTVGLVWAGRPQHWNDKNRSISLETLAPLLDIAGIQWMSLQKGEPAGQLFTFRWSSRVLDFTSDLHDFTDTAALIDNLDLVLSVDTSVVHLTGAMGKPTWVLLPFASDWRWHRHREDSPWYPSLRFFRQTIAGDWTPAVQQIARELS